MRFFICVTDKGRAQGGVGRTDAAFSDATYFMSYRMLYPVYDARWRAGAVIIVQYPDYRRHRSPRFDYGLSFYTGSSILTLSGAIYTTETFSSRKAGYLKAHISFPASLVASWFQSLDMSALL